MVLSKDMKIAICFGLLMGAIISICNLCFAAENVSFDIIPNINIDSFSDTFVSSSYRLGYFEIEPGYQYTISNPAPAGSRWCAFSNELAVVGDTCYDRYLINSDGSISFTYSDMSYVFFNINYTSTVTVIREPLQGMTNFVDNMAYSLSIGDLSQVWVLVVPIIAISVLLGLGFYLLKRLLNRIKRAKGGV